MRLIDISLAFAEGMPSYAAAWYPRFGLRPAMTAATDPAGLGRTFTQILLNPHNATHVDAPGHFFAGRAGAADLPLSPFFGRAVIADLSAKGALDPISGDDLERAAAAHFRPGDRLLIATQYLDCHWGEPDFWDRPPYLEPSAAAWAIEHGASLVGLDCLTEEPGHREMPVHRALLGHEVPILEYLCNLGVARERRPWLCAFPAKIAGVEASPVRAVLAEDVAWPD